MKHVNIILPLPLEGQFTYSVPDKLENRAIPGTRALVPLGKSKKYIGIITGDAIPSAIEKPIEYKNIIAVLDDQPIILPQQFRLWTWIADYYMAPLGDVMKAALPTGLKQLETYKPRVELFVTLQYAFQDESKLHRLLDSLARAPKQLAIVETFIDMAFSESSNTELSNVLLGQDVLLNRARSNPAALKALVQKSVLRIEEHEVGRLNTSLPPRMENIKPLNRAQSEAHENIVQQMQSHAVTLLHGVTSSGKTEIYIHLISEALDRDEQVLYLLPEIALTVQMMQRLRDIFGSRLGIYHSKYSDAERVEIWQKQLSPEPYDVILGARSAVFLPFKRLGLVIIDEEHETSFKQQDPAPRYHARSAAIILAQIYRAKTLLGTATPAIETYNNAREGKYGLVTLTKRYKDIKLPEIEIVDTKDLRRRKMMSGFFSPRLISAIRTALSENKQVILFQNRRGFAPMIECPICGWIPKCPNCDVSLTHHKSTDIITCHYCGYTTRLPEKCPNCESNEIRGRGYGTEKVEDAVSELFPEARIARMDLDTTRSRNAYEKLISDFATGRTNLLIGTQMVSKGLDFDNVSVVGILDADSIMNYPDFRAHELAFAMMSQVSGRAGRKGKQGLVILQTKSPKLPLIRQLMEADYSSFFADQLSERRKFHYPPFYRLIYIYLKHRNENIVNSAALELGSRLREILGSRVLGPDKPAVARIKTLFIRKIVLKLENGIDYTHVRTYLRQVNMALLADKHYSSIQIYFDVDPV